jgi:hypothetical protein
LGIGVPSSLKQGRSKDLSVGSADADRREHSGFVLAVLMLRTQTILEKFSIVNNGILTIG